MMEPDKSDKETGEKDANKRPTEQQAEWGKEQKDQKDQKEQKAPPKKEREKVECEKLRLVDADIDGHKTVLCALTQVKGIGVIAIVLLAQAFAGVGILLLLPAPAAGYTPHAPIAIYGNPDFIPANGVTGGTGTPADPYVIEGWDIDSTLTHGIWIQNTDAHAVIRNVSVHGTDWQYDGILLDTVANVIVEYAVLNGSGNGVSVWNSNGVLAANNSIANPSWECIHVANSSAVTARGNVLDGCTVYGINAYLSTALDLSANTVTNSGAGFYLQQDDGATLTGNNVSSIDPMGTGYGIYMDVSWNVTAFANDLWTATYGAVVFSSQEVLLWQNTVGASTAEAVSVAYSNNVTIVENDFTSNDAGIYATLAVDMLIAHNNFVGNVLPGGNASGTRTLWDDGYPSGGNYWSDYAGVDVCSGPAQDICPDADGIGDTPYALDAETSDRYPLMQPYVPDQAPMAPVMLPSSLSGAGLADVTVNWQLSPDDGAGANDVVGYQILAGGTYAATGAGYTLLATVPAGTSSYVDVGAGSASRFYIVVAVDGNGFHTATADQGGKFVTHHQQGARLLSIPFELATDDIATILGTLTFNTAWWYDPLDTADHWKSYSPSKPFNDLSKYNRTMAIWVDVISDGDLIVAGRIPQSTDIPIHAGWNLIGYPSITERTVADVFSSVAYERIEGFDPGAPGGLRLLGDQDWLSPGGYWVRASSPGTVTVGNT